MHLSDNSLFPRLNKSKSNQKAIGVEISLLGLVLIFLNIFSTGTGSTSWTFNINKLTHHSVRSLIKIINEMSECSVDYDDKKLVEAITQKFNNDIVFDPELNLMAYSLRDPVSVGTFPLPDSDERKPRGKVKRIEVKSRLIQVFVSPLILITVITLGTVLTPNLS